MVQPSRFFPYIDFFNERIYEYGDKVKVQQPAEPYTIPSEENHIWPDLFNHLLRHLTLPGDLRPSGCRLTYLIDNPCGILNIVFGTAFEYVVFGDAAEFAVYRHLVGRGPLAARIVGVSHVVGR